MIPKINPIVLWFGCIISFFLLAKTFELLQLVDFYEKPFSFGDEGCIKITSIGASEDQTKFNNNSVIMTQWRVAGYISADEMVPGAMFVASGFQAGDKETPEFVKNDLKVQELPITNYPKGVDFHPHGIYIRKEDKSLYVINHAYEKGGERIDVFGIVTEDDGDDDPENDIPTRLHYQYSISSDWMKNEMDGSLNSIVVVEKNKFYVTQYMSKPHRPDGSMGTKLSLLCSVLMGHYFGWKKTYLWYCEYDESSSSPLNCQKAAGPFVSANGLTHNDDYSQIFVGGGAKDVNIYNRDPSTNQLSKRQFLRTRYYVDNLKFDDVSGNVYGGTINNMWYTLQYEFPEERPELTAGLVRLTEAMNSYRDGTMWRSKAQLSTNKLHGISNGIRMGQQYILGAGGLGYEGILVCPVDETIEEVMYTRPPKEDTEL